MSKHIEDVPISELRNLITRINDTYDYNFGDYALASFKRRIINMLNDRQFGSCEELLQVILRSQEDFSEFLADITVNTTEMFRDPEFWKYFKDQCLALFSDKSSIKIWHAGCSSGEEVFSMAILLEEAGIYDKCNLTATDISHAILEKAEKGEYSLSKLEINTKNYQKFDGKHTLDKYYTQEGRKVKFDPALLRNVTFREHNLAKKEQIGKFDIIICRNVMIYFNSNLQDEVYKLFHKSLVNGGLMTLALWIARYYCSPLGVVPRIHDLEFDQQQVPHPESNRKSV